MTEYKKVMIAGGVIANIIIGVMGVSSVLEGIVTGNWLAWRITSPIMFCCIGCLIGYIVGSKKEKK